MSRGGFVERLGVVGDGAVDESGLAAVADAGATRPVGGYVAGLGELEQAAVAFVPWDGQRGAAEGDLGAPARRPGGRVGVGGVIAWLGPEDLAVQARGFHAPAEQGAGQLAQEGRGAAEVEVGVAGDAEFEQGIEVDAAGLVEVNAPPVAGRGTAVADV